MRHGASVWIRTGRVAATLQEVSLRQEVAVREAVARVAAAVGLDPEEVMAEAQTLLMRAWAARARTDAEVVAFVAGEQGMTEAELQAELAQVGACR